METPKYKTKEEVLEKALTANGHTFSEYDINNRLQKKNNKGKLGQIMEEGLFGYPVNSSAEADFNNIGVEFKVTGIKQLKKGVKFNNKQANISAKERLSLKEINYFDLANQEFEESYLWQKIQCMLLMFYLYSETKSEGEMEILDSILHTFSKEDYEIIKQDYDVLRKKVLNGEAHLISESDTMYLGACRKGAGGENDTTKQPFSDVKANKRGYCLKNSYLTEIIRNKYIDNVNINVIDSNGLKQFPFEEIIEQKLSLYYGKSKRDLCKIFDVNEDAKDANSKIIAKIFGANRINNINEFIKSGITIKTIELKTNGEVKEEMSFKPFVFQEIIDEQWYESETRKMFSNKFLFIVFQLTESDESIFKKIKFWNMPESLLDSEIKNVFEKTQETLRSGDVVLSLTKRKRIYKFPKAKEYPICFVKNHASSVNVVDKLPVKDINFDVECITKQSFWLGKGFIKSIID